VSTVLGVITAVAEAEVVKAPPHAAECVADHPNQPCPGYPHQQED
jgi:hypothetical protein